MKLTRLAPIAILFAGLLSPALADEYLDAISKAFPGFQILGPSDIKLYKEQMDQEIYERVKDRPGMAVGKFNSDQRSDFAALIRGTIKKRDTFGNDYYDGYLVVCYGLAAGGFDCAKMSPAPREFSLPFGWYLEKVAPGKHFCHALGKLDTQKKESGREEKHEVNITTKTDSIGYFRTLGNGDIMYAYQGKTVYKKCILTD